MPEPENLFFVKPILNSPYDYPDRHWELDDHMGLASGKVCLCTMHQAKGLEFRAVAVMACDDQILPSQSRIEAITDEADLEEVYATERHLLYVAVTRARDRLLVSSAGHASEFLNDLQADHFEGRIVPHA